MHTVLKFRGKPWAGDHHQGPSGVLGQSSIREHLWQGVGGIAAGQRHCMKIARIHSSGQKEEADRVVESREEFTDSFIGGKRGEQFV